MLDIHLEKRLGSFHLSATFSNAGFIGIEGPNGSGKSTLFNCIAGLIRPDSGRVLINGTDITPLPIEKRGVVLVTPGSAIRHLSVDNHLKWGPKSNPRRLEDPLLAEVRGRLNLDWEGKVGELSLGNRERVSLGTALLARPRVILADESFSNISEMTDFARSYRALASEIGVDVLVSFPRGQNPSMEFDHLYSMESGNMRKTY
jgi:molybdate/tungstate transport system ATP-binding protein